MDSYLPADFHALHDAVQTDWRDRSSSATSTELRAAVLRDADGRAGRLESLVDPTWQTL